MKNKPRLSPLRMTVGFFILITVIGLIYAFLYFTNTITVSVNDYDYHRSGSGVEIIRYTGEAKDIVIPEKINDCKVIAIADKAFYDIDNLRDVDIPKTVKKVGKQAFANCDGMEIVRFFSGYTEFGEGAFENSSVQSVALPNKMQKISRAMFKNCRAVQKVSFPDNLKEISDEAFEGCISLSEMVVGENIQKIGKNAFAGTADSFALSSLIGSVTESYAYENGIEFKPCDSTYRKYTAYEAFEGINKYKTSKVSASNGGMLSFRPKKSGYYLISVFGGNGIRLSQEGESGIICSQVHNDEGSILMKPERDKTCYLKLSTTYSHNISVEIKHIADDYAKLMIRGEQLIKNEGELVLKAGTALYDTYSSDRSRVADISSDITLKKVLDYYIDSKNRIWYKINVSVGEKTKRDLWLSTSA